MGDLPSYPVFYRYSDFSGGGEVVVTREKYHVHRETAKCWYVVSDGWQVFANPPKSAIKRVLKGSPPEGSKRYCYEDIEQAFASFRRRKRRQLHILERQHEVCQRVVDALNEGTLKAPWPKHTNLGATDPAPAALSLEASKIKEDFEMLAEVEKLREELEKLRAVEVKDLVMRALRIGGFTAEEVNQVLSLVTSFQTNKISEK